MLVTETWVQAGAETDEIFEDLVNGAHLGVVRRDRAGRRGGGVAVIYDQRKAKLKRYQIPGAKHEIVCSVGKFNSSNRKVAIICVYLPPKQTKKTTDEIAGVLSNGILKLKADLDDPIILVGGDLNNKDLSAAYEDYDDIHEIPAVPTRGTRALDLAFTNMATEDATVTSLPPLSSDNGPRSDHNVVIVEARLPRLHQFKKRKITYRKITEDGKRRFKALLDGTDWGELEGLSSSGAADALAVKLKVMLDQCFPLRSFMLKSTDPPWMTPKIRKAIRRRKRLFKREGRSEAWRRLKKETEDLIKHAKQERLETIKQLIKETNDVKGYYRAIKNFSTKEEKLPWDVRSLFPGKTDLQIAEIVAAFFVKISDEFVPLPGPLDSLSESDAALRVARSPSATTIARRLKKMHKPKSQVDGDIPPELVGENASGLSVPLAIIFRKVYETLQWPRLWKIETVSVIPKNSSPSDISELRNISCTPLFSKLLEAFVLEKIKEETTLTEKQFGGMKGSGPAHFLALTWQEILETLDDSRAAAVLTSIDFEKAFNRMGHASCLNALAAHNASGETISLVSAFLYGRTMRVKIGTALSEPRNVLGGSPQGSILGNILFCITTDFLDEQAQPRLVMPAASTPLDLRRNRSRVRGCDGHVFDDDAATEQVVSAMDLGDDGADSDGDDPMGFFRFRRQFEFDSTPEDEIEVLGRSGIDHVNGGPPQGWEDRPLKKFVYIDDYNSVEQVRQHDAVFHLTQSGRTVDIRAPHSQSLFHCIHRNAEEIGMRVNARKTQMLCISSASSNQCNSHIIGPGGEKISSTENLKILGFLFGRSPTPQAQVSNMLKKVRARFWTLYYLKSSGLSEKDLVSAYVSFIRPLMEYAVQAFHSMMTQEQSKSIERQQSRALKVIFGFGHSYSDLLQKSGLKTLQERRVKLTDKFAMKLASSDRFSYLFPERPEEQCRARNGNKYVEMQSRTSRLYNSPIYYMRRRLNKLHKDNRSENARVPVEQDLRCDFLFDEWR